MIKEIILHKEVINMLRGLTMLSALNTNNYRIQLIEERSHVENQYFIFEDNSILDCIIFCSSSYEDQYAEYTADEPKFKIRLFFKDIDLEYVNYEDGFIGISTNIEPKSFFECLE